MIIFNKPLFTGKELEYIAESCAQSHISGNGPFGKRCEVFIREKVRAKQVLMTHSCTGALEIAAHVLNVQKGDEVIMPSYTYVSTASAFVHRGAVPVFVDIRPDTLNIDENLIEAAVTPRTKGIVAMHYAGVGCEMHSIMEIALRRGLWVVEDAAQCFDSKYHGRPLGSFGSLGALSFHETKNVTAGQGGALLINAESLMKRAHHVRDKGTNRLEFQTGKIDKYEWVDLGSSYHLSDLNAAYLWAQLEVAERIRQKRIRLWKRYFKGLSSLAASGAVELPVVPAHCAINGHLFYLKCQDSRDRAELMRHLANQGVMSVFHYVPLHSSPAGRRFGRFHGQDQWTTRESERLLRLPLWYDMDPVKHVDAVIQAVASFKAFTKAVL